MSVHPGGLSSLPDELLVHILQVLGELTDWAEDWRSEEIPASVGNVFLVSKRFYRCARDATSLWNLTQRSVDFSNGGVTLEEMFSLDVKRESIMKAEVRDLNIWYPRAIGNVLSNTSPLRYLSLGFYTSGFLPTRPAEDELLRYRLPNLEYLHLEIAMDGEYREADSTSGTLSMGAFLYVLDMPSLRDLRISFCWTWPKKRPHLKVDIAGRLKAVLCVERRSYPSVSHLDLLRTTDESCLRPDRSMCEVNLSSILPAFPNIRSLSLHEFTLFRYRMPQSSVDILRRNKRSRLSFLRIGTGQRRAISEPYMNCARNVILGLISLGSPLINVDVHAPGFDDDFIEGIRTVFPSASRVIPFL